MLGAVDYIFNLLCAFNCLQPMKKFLFSVASRATGQLQIKPSGSGDENAPSLLLLFREDTILIILSGVVGEAKKLSLKEPLKYDLWSTVELSLIHI